MRVIAEVGCNHQADMSKATMMIASAARAGAYMVKFQKRTNRILLTPEEYNAPHPNPKNSYGATYGEHREFLEFNQDQHYALKKACESHGVEYCSSVWDWKSALEIKQIGPNHIKIPSACNMVEGIYKQLEGFKGMLHVSMGMTEMKDFSTIKNLLERHRLTNTVIYACTSGYPVRPDETFLYEIGKLRCSFLGYTIGFSGHHEGIILDLGALSLGAEYLERHYTFDKNAKGTDHCASLVEEELTELCKNIKDLDAALRYKHEMPEVEKVQYRKLKK